MFPELEPVRTIWYWVGWYAGWVIATAPIWIVLLAAALERGWRPFGVTRRDWRTR